MTSETWIEKWENERAKYKRLGLPLSRFQDRITRHKASLILGRDFGETVDNYIERRGLTEYFYNWNLRVEDKI